MSIKLRFFDPSEPEGGNDPTVIKIASYGEHGSTRTGSRKMGHKSRVGIDLKSGNLMTLGASYEQETHWTTISSLIMHDQYRIWGGKNVAYWHFSANKDQQSGVPMTIRVAVLLQRKKAEGQFSMEFDIEAKVDNSYQGISKLQRLFCRQKRDEAITFDPNPKYALPTERSDVDSENLELCDLEYDYPVEKVPRQKKRPKIVLYKPGRSRYSPMSFYMWGLGLVAKRHSEPRSVYLDLTSYDKKSIAYDELLFMKNPEFETILQSVWIPQISIYSPPPDLNPISEYRSIRNMPSERAPEQRRDVEYVLHCLKEQGVTQILEIEVMDFGGGQWPPGIDCHSHEVIERALSPFNVITWNWKQYDICTDTILTAAPNVKELYLYSRGNKTVLLSWSGADGLGRLKEVCP